MEAPELLSDAIEPEVALVALGPALTNLAEAVQKHLGVLDEDALMYLMDGAVDAGGNSLDNPGVGFNTWADPLAAQRG